VGTDIHFYVQKRHPERPEEWVTVEDAPDEALSEFDRDFYAKHGWKAIWYNGRNYSLFAILANVRNGVGFAGIDTGDGYRTMTSEQRGLPDDFVPSEYILENDPPDGGHSANWVSLKEVLDFPWKDLETKCRGWVDEGEFKAWMESEQSGPRSYSGGVSGPMVRHVDVPTMTGIVRGTVPREEGERISYVCQLEWGETYWESCRFFCETTVPALEKLADGDPESVRLVFWFDS
jgi:hypothetical protein